MTARQLRWIIASIALALEITSFVAFVAFMMRRHEAPPATEPGEPVETPEEKPAE